MNTLHLLFQRKWLFTTIIVIAAVGVMVRLGIWQLDRYQQRREFNRNYLTQAQSPPLHLTINKLTPELDLTRMAYRRITVTGTYDHTREVAIRNQSRENKPGVHLLTPLLIDSSDSAILVDRGWIPLESYQSESWSAYEISGPVTVAGIIRTSQEEPSFGGRRDPTPTAGETIKAWNFVNIPRIAAQIPYPVVDIYVQESPNPTNTALPLPTTPDIEITDGPHLGYAIQWFSFASILGIGYPFFIKRENR